MRRRTRREKPVDEALGVRRPLPHLYTYYHWLLNDLLEELTEDAWMGLAHQEQGAFPKARHRAQHLRGTHAQQDGALTSERIGLSVMNSTFHLGRLCDACTGQVFSRNTQVDRQSFRKEGTT